MTQIFFPLDPSDSCQKLYCYTNGISKIVISQVRTLLGKHLERVIFPGEKFLFQANNDCGLEISQQTNSGIIQDFIPCEQLLEVASKNHS
ncbi:MAG: DUF1830 domain-containing protein [Pleurocapsa sp.]